MFNWRNTLRRIVEYVGNGNIQEEKFDFYLAGGMRGYQDLNHPQFILVTKLLRAKGYKVWSPQEHETYVKSSFAECMNRDLNAVINKCDRIALLPEWRKSLGANVEAFSAFVCGKPAVQIHLIGDNLADLMDVNLSKYHLPYNRGERYKFDPHKCAVDAPEPESLVNQTDEERASCR